MGFIRRHVFDPLFCQPQGDDRSGEAVHTDMGKGHALIEEGRSLFFAFHDIVKQALFILDPVLFSDGRRQGLKDSDFRDGFIPNQNVPRRNPTTQRGAVGR